MIESIQDSRHNSRITTKRLAVAVGAGILVTNGLLALTLSSLYANRDTLGDKIETDFKADYGADGKCLDNTMYDNEHHPKLKFNSDQRILTVEPPDWDENVTEFPGLHPTAALALRYEDGKFDYVGRETMFVLVSAHCIDATSDH